LSFVLCYGGCFSFRKKRGENWSEEKEVLLLDVRKEWTTAVEAASKKS